MANENYSNLENENNELKEKINYYENKENEDSNLKDKINEISLDYQRLLKENNSLKFAIHSQNI